MVERFSTWLYSSYSANLRFYIQGGGRYPRPFASQEDAQFESPVSGLEMILPVRDSHFCVIDDDLHLGLQGDRQDTVNLFKNGGRSLSIIKASRVLHCLFSVSLQGSSSGSPLFYVRLRWKPLCF